MCAMPRAKPPPSATPSVNLRGREKVGRLKFARKRLYRPDYTPKLSYAEVSFLASILQSQQTVLRQIELCYYSGTFL